MLPELNCPIALHPQPDVDAFATGLLLGQGRALFVEGDIPLEVRELSELHGVGFRTGRPAEAFLVDHAVRSGWNVVGAMDHHPLEALPRYPLLWAPLGSCATLAWLATRGWARNPLVQDTVLRAIVADTALFRSPRSTPLDEALARELGDPTQAAHWVFRRRESAESLRRTHMKRVHGVEVVSVEYLEWDPEFGHLQDLCRQEGAVLLLSDVANATSLLCHDHPALERLFPTRSGRHAAGRLLSRSMDIAPALKPQAG